MDCSSAGSSGHGISQARIPVRGAHSFSRGSSWPKDWTRPRLLHWQADSLPLSHQLWGRGEVKWSCSVVSDSLQPHGLQCSLPGSSIHGIFQARILEWVATAFSRRSSRSRDWTQVSRIVGRRLTVWAARAVLIYCSVPLSDLGQTHMVMWLVWESYFILPSIFTTLWRLGKLVCNTYPC